MNKGELEADQAEKEAERLRDLEASIEGISSVSSVFQHSSRIYCCMLNFQCLEMAGKYIVGWLHLIYAYRICRRFVSSVLSN